MNTSPRRLIIVGVALWLLPMFVSTIVAQTADASPRPTSSDASQSTTEGIQKRDNEWGVWGSMPFKSTTLIGKTPDAKFGNIGLRYGRVLATSKTVAFEMCWYL